MSTLNSLTLSLDFLTLTGDTKSMSESTEIYEFSDDASTLRIYDRGAYINIEINGAADSVDMTRAEFREFARAIAHMYI